MANTNLSLSLTNGNDGFKLSDITVGTSAPGTGDYEFRVNATDANSNVLTRKGMVIALKAFLRVIESGAIFTTDLDF